MPKDIVNIMIGGEAGQGLATVGSGLAKALVRGGYAIVMTQSYMSRIRGGHNTMVIRAATGEVSAPQEPVDLLIALNQETVDLHSGEMSEDGLVVADTELKVDGAKALAVPYSELASGRHANVAALGVAAAMLGLKQDLLHGVLKALFKKLDAEAVEKNRKALADAYAWAEGQSSGFMGLGPAQGGEGRLTLNGNESIALGAMSAGVKFVSFYPMTPATSIVLNLVAHAEKMGIVAEQAEDEISAINMAIGAAYAGAPSLVATSGGGFALMGEGISLAGMTETPVMVAISQRPGPATGLPTRTEQGDLEMVLHAGHGDFARAIYAPGDVEECFHLARQALFTAWEFQTPVFMLTDQFLADSYRAVEPFPVDELNCLAPPAPTDDPDYKRYAITESGISPLALPGAGQALVVADSDEHTEDGHITEDLGVRKLMVEKRLRKLAGLREKAVAPAIDGDPQPELLLVSWGSVKGSAAEAAARLRQEGRKVGTCHFGQLWPFDEQQFLPAFENAGMVVFVESNAAGQFAKLIRRETGFAAARLVLRYDGLPITPEYILSQLAK